MMRWHEGLSSLTSLRSTESSFSAELQFLWKSFKMARCSYGGQSMYLSRSNPPIAPDWDTISYWQVLRQEKNLSIWNIVNITGAVGGKKLRWIKKKKIVCVLKGTDTFPLAVFIKFPLSPCPGTRVIFVIAGAGWACHPRLLELQLLNSVGA